MNSPFLAQCIATFLLIVSISYAEVPDTTVKKNISDTIIPVEGIVVTATRSKRRISETPASVSIITRSEIKASPAKTIEDLLATQTNVQLRRSAPIGEGVPSDISIRGIPGALAASRTLILVDGIPTNASGTPFLIVNEVPMEAIERVEVVRGPNSSLYGANALGGVINILTREGQGKPKGDVVAETSYPFTAANLYDSHSGSIGKVFDSSIKMAYWNVNGTVSGGTDKTGFLVSTGYRTIGDYLLRDYAFVRKANLTKTMKNKNHDYEEYRLLGKVRLISTDSNSASLHVRFFKSTLGFGKTKAIIPDSQDVETRGQKFLVGPQIKFAVSDKILLKAGAFYRNVIGEFQDEGLDSSGKHVQTVWQSTTNDGQFESQAVIVVGSSNVITSGFELLSNNANFGATKNPVTGEIIAHSVSTEKGIANGAVFIQDEMKLINKRLNVVPSIRLDYHSTFGSALSPKLGINCKILEQLRFRASIGRSFRAPSLAELYMSDLRIDTNYVVRCNPLLKPEYLVGSDAGIETILWKALTFKIDVYYNKMYDLIGQKIINDVTKTYIFLITHRNISRAWSDGIESEINWRPSARFWVSANTSLQNSLDEIYGKKLDYTPDYTFGFRSGLTWTMKSILSSAIVGFRQIGQRSYQDFSNPKQIIPSETEWRVEPNTVVLSSYNTVDLSLKFSRSRYSFVITGQNILNASGEESFGTFIPGRFASMKVGISF